MENYEAALALAEELKDKKITVKMKAGEGGRTFGSVSTKEIAAAAKEQLGMELDKKKMQLPEPIRSFGMTEVAIRLHPKVTGTCCRRVAGGLFHGRGTGKADYAQQS